MKTKTITLYEFDELTTEAQDRAISDHINFWLEAVVYEQGSDNYKKAIDASERMRTPWFTGTYIYEYCRDEIVEEIKINEYHFTSTGKICSKG